MPQELEKDFFCEKCNQRVSKCYQNEDGLCEDYVGFIRRNNHIEMLNNQDIGKMTVSECMMLHGRLATLKVLGEKRMASKLEEYEPIVNHYRDLWEKENVSDEEIQDWIEDRDEIEKEKIRKVFDFYIKEVGVFLSDNHDKII
jgi:hypothetical protein